MQKPTFTGSAPSAEPVPFLLLPPPTTLQGFQQEITLNTNKIDALIVFGENLIQKSAPLDAALIEDELEELHSYCQEVFGRVARFHHRLVNRRPVSNVLSDSFFYCDILVSCNSRGNGNDRTVTGLLEKSSP